MKKIISVVGTRPEFIKIAALAPHMNEFFNHLIIHTGQHYDYELSKVFFGELKIPQPAYNLGVKLINHGAQTGTMLGEIEKILIYEKPDLVTVYGDTNTTLAGALAAAKLSIPIVHVEAGMRSYDRAMPEEVNRLITDHVSSLFFCPSKTAVKNLKKEGIVKNVFFTGDVMYDIFLEVKPSLSIFREIRYQPKAYYFCTMHRAENTNDFKRLKNLFEVINNLNKPVLLPIHPRTTKALSKLKLRLKNVKLIKPVRFAESITLQKNSAAIITDSGGIQKEAYWLKVPCFTLRNTTEWPETVETGWNFLVLANLKKLPDLVKNFKKPEKHPNLYGEGTASFKIAKITEKFLND